MDRGAAAFSFLGTQKAVPLEHTEELLPSALPGAHSSFNAALWTVTAYMAALLGAHSAEQVFQ